VGQRIPKRVVLDTNVVVSGLLFGGVPGKLEDLWKNRAIVPVVTKEIVDEYVLVFAYPKFDLTQDEINYLLYHEILPYFEPIPSIKHQSVIVSEDPSDDKFLLCAEAGKCEAIITGDQHLLSLGEYKDIRIMSAGEFLKG